MLLFNKANNFDEDDDTSKNGKIKFNSKKLGNKIPLIVGIVSVVLILVGIVMYNIYNVQYYLELNGEDNITIYLNHEYSEFGFNAYDSKGNDLTRDVIVDSNLNINKIGNYQISYTIGNITKVRYVNVIEGGKTELKLKGESVVYLLAGTNYYLQCFNRDCGYRKSTIEIGDILAKKGHVRIVIGKDGDKIIVAEGYGTSVGVVINYHDNPSQYVVIDGKYLIDNYTLVSSSDYPSGF